MLEYKTKLSVLQHGLATDQLDPVLAENINVLDLTKAGILSSIRRRN